MYDIISAAMLNTEYEADIINTVMINMEYEAVVADIIHTVMLITEYEADIINAVMLNTEYEAVVVDEDEVEEKQLYDIISEGKYDDNYLVEDGGEHLIKGDGFKDTEGMENEKRNLRKGFEDVTRVDDDPEDTSEERLDDSNMVGEK
jgi:hypothetical protein